jgi:chaperonin GroES
MTAIEPKQPRQHIHADVELIPVGDKIIVRAISGDRATASGIILPAADRDAPLMGEVLAVGEGRISEHNVQLPMPIKKGDRIIYHRYSGSEVQVGEKPSILILELDDVMAIVKEA